jgi:GH24 family phage-related lysozyme (muramidase)
MNVQEQILLSKQQQEKDKKQDLHRKFNSIVIIAILCCAVYASYAIRSSFNDVRTINNQAAIELIAAKVEVESVKTQFERISKTQHRASEISQLMVDEGFRKCIYDDSRGLATIGFGHLMLANENYTCINYRQAVELLRKDYDYAANSVDSKYPWASGEVRLVLINMTYQMGQTGVSKFKLTLTHLKYGVYDEAAIELLDSLWAEQTTSRALRLAGRIMSIPVTEGS